MAQAVTLDPRSIEQEIAAIRERESNPYAAGIRTNLFNLVIFRGAVGKDSMEPALQYLLGKRPARIVTIQHSGDPQSSVSVSGRCFPDKRNRGVCFEEIQISSGIDGRGVDPGTWHPLLIRDIPVYAWWLDRLVPPPPPLSQAAEVMEKLLVDTSFASVLGAEPPAVFRELLLLREKTRGALVISDLSWKRLYPIRVQVARAFNPEGMRERLTRVSGVFFSGGSHAEGILFFLWLAARLGWRVVSIGQKTELEGPGGRRLLAVHESGGPLLKGFRIEIAFTGDARGVGISCREDGCIIMGEDKAAYHPLTDGEALLEEVDTLKQDGVYLEALKAAAGAG